MKILIEFVRTEKSDDPYAFSFVTQTYLLRTGLGAYKPATLDWSDGWLEELAYLQRLRVDSERVAKVGNRLRRFLVGADWEIHERDIELAIASGEPVELVIRSSAAELYALPWELLRLQSTGQAIGELLNLVIRYEWPGTRTVAAARPSGGRRVLVAWSAAGGAVPAAEHIKAIQQAANGAGIDFDPALDVVAHATARSLARALHENRPSALHLLGHGIHTSGVVGLALAEQDGGSRVLDASGLRRVVAPYAATLRTVVLCACRSGDSGRMGGHIGSLAQGLHRAGIETVLGSRFPLEVEASTDMTRAFYRVLLSSGDPIRAFVDARLAMAVADNLQWASLQLERRAEQDHLKKLDPLGRPSEEEPPPSETPAEPAPGDRSGTAELDRIVPEALAETPRAITPPTTEVDRPPSVAPLWVRVERGRLAGRVFRLSDRAVRVGARAPAQIVLPDRGISGRHGTFRRGEDGWMFVDDGSTNKTRVAGEYLIPHEPYHLDRRTVLDFGGAAVCVGSPEEIGLEPVPDLELVCRGRMIPVPEGGLLLGREDSHGIVGVGGGAVGVAHLRLERTGYGLVATDLETVSGTALNGSLISGSPVLVLPGDTLVLAGEVRVTATTVRS